MSNTIFIKKFLDHAYNYEDSEEWRLKDIEYKDILKAETNIEKKRANIMLSLMSEDDLFKALEDTYYIELIDDFTYNTVDYIQDIIINELKLRNGKTNAEQTQTTRR